MFTKCSAFLQHIRAKGDSPLKPRRLRAPGAPSGARHGAKEKRAATRRKATMARPKKHGDEGTVPVSFRLTTTERLAYLDKCEAAGLSPSDFFRDCVLTNKTQIVARPKASADRQRLLYLVNKTSNNINQLAHRANSDHLAGKLSEARYEEIIDNLEMIARFLKATIPHVD